MPKTKTGHRIVDEQLPRKIILKAKYVFSLFTRQLWWNWYNQFAVLVTKFVIWYTVEFQYSIQPTKHLKSTSPQMGLEPRCLTTNSTAIFIKLKLLNWKTKPSHQPSTAHLLNYILTLYRGNMNLCLEGITTTLKLPGHGLEHLVIGK